MKNISKKRCFTHVLKSIVAIYFGASCALLPISVGHSEPLRAPVAAGLPRLGEAGALDLTAERELGDRIAQQIYRDPDYMDDPVLVGYLDAIWQPLLAAAQARGDVPADLSERFAWKLMPVRDRTCLLYPSRCV